MTKKTKKTDDINNDFDYDSQKKSNVESSEAEKHKELATDAMREKIRKQIYAEIYAEEKEKIEKEEIAKIAKLNTAFKGDTIMVRLKGERDRFAQIKNNPKNIEIWRPLADPKYGIEGFSEIA